MGRIVGLDYGSKKCGLAATDVLQIIVNAIDTVATSELHDFFDKYMYSEEVDKLVVGIPKHKDGSDTYLRKDIDKFVEILSKKYPELIIDYEDETLTSVQAKEIIFQSGIKKSKRRDKTLIDKVSAVLILQRYLGHI